MLRRWLMVLVLACGTVGIAGGSPASALNGATTGINYPGMDSCQTYATTAMDEVPPDRWTS
jgi:hypothetical protein